MNGVNGEKCSTCSGSGIQMEDHGQGLQEPLSCWECKGTGRSSLPVRAAPEPTVDELLALGDRMPPDVFVSVADSDFTLRMLLRIVAGGLGGWQAERENLKRARPAPPLLPPTDECGVCFHERQKHQLVDDYGRNGCTARVDSAWTPDNTRGCGCSRLATDPDFGNPVPRGIPMTAEERLPRPPAQKLDL